MTAAPALHDLVRITRIKHLGFVTAIDARLREARVSGHPHDVPWSALESV